MAHAQKRTELPPRERLREYRAKRHFDRTPEPSGNEPARRRAAAPGLSFVIQKHAASHLHYDFRLELDGVLLSWSVPKGPSLSPSTRRLAMRTEDHPLDYADFEGIIPEGEYGGGTVIVWDRGTWTPEGDPRAGMAKGHLTFDLEGDKLHGRWHLVRSRDQGNREAWLLFKGHDDAASDTTDIVAERPESAVTGRTLDEVAEARDRVWRSNRASKNSKDTPPRRSPRQRAQRPAARSTEPTKQHAAAGDHDERDHLIELVQSLPVDIPLTNLDKVLYPEQGLTKAALIAYLAVAKDWILPHLAGRPLTLVRCPSGRQKHCFFQKHAKDSDPDAIQRIEIAEDDGTAEYMMLEDFEGLITLAQMGALELHTWGCHYDKVERPDVLVFDLDPDPELDWSVVVEAAFDLRQRLGDLGLESLVKTTGGKGLHIVVPVERRIGWDEFKAFAKAFADRMADDEPDRYTTNPLKARRKGKIFVDYLRNGRGATFIAPYSPRARANAPVAVPVTWEELENGLDPSELTIITVPGRLDALEQDPWAEYADIRQAITAPMRRKVGMVSP